MEVTYQLTADDFQRELPCSQLNPHGIALRNLAPLYVLLILWIVWFFGAPYISARSQFRGSPSAKSPMSLTTADEGLHFRSQQTDSKVDCSAYVNWVEGKAIFAIFPHPRIFIVIPKRAFSSDQLIEFRELLRQKIKRK